MDGSRGVQPPVPPVASHLANNRLGQRIAGREGPERARCLRVRTLPEDTRMEPPAGRLTASAPLCNSDCQSHDKGTPGESRGRKATGPRHLRNAGSRRHERPKHRRAAERCSALTLLVPACTLAQDKA